MSNDVECEECGRTGREGFVMFQGEIMLCANEAACRQRAAEKRRPHHRGGPVKSLRLTIAIQCVPKPGKADKLDAALWKVVQRYSKQVKPQTIHTDYEYMETE